MSYTNFILTHYGCTVKITVIKAGMILQSKGQLSVHEYRLIILSFHSHLPSLEKQLVEYQ